jgi:hypothetical protein
MRADYATSDLISRVNAEWLNEVLANREFDRTGPGDDVPGNDVPGNDVPRANTPRNDVPVDEVHRNSDRAGDLRLRREFARKRTILLQRGSGRMDDHDPDITAMPLARSSRQRSVARRIKERLALAIAALALVAVAVWMASEPQDVTSSIGAQAANAAPEPAVPVDTSQTKPAWLLPEILYGPAMARSPMLPKPGR